MQKPNSFQQQHLSTFPPWPKCPVQTSSHPTCGTNMPPWFFLLQVLKFAEKLMRWPQKLGRGPNCINTQEGGHTNQHPSIWRGPGPHQCPTRRTHQQKADTPINTKADTSKVELRTPTVNCFGKNTSGEHTRTMENLSIAKEPGRSEALKS